MAPAWHWDVFCRVVDNFGDIGVCWRLAADLASRGQRVRLRTNDRTALTWMAPRGHSDVEVLAWEDADSAPSCGDVVIEAFGCEPPEVFVRRMARRTPKPVWVNLEYLSAEAQARRNHGLPSPQLSGPGAGLDKWFFYPGFVPGSGGLIREADLDARQRDFDAAPWLATTGLRRQPSERLVSLFCYDDSALAELIDVLQAEPTLLVATAGTAARQVQSVLGPTLRRGALRAVALPWLTQVDFDHLLWSCDLNLVRGEDSWVRAQWAGRPFVWQAYRQTDAAHRAKIEAFLDLHLNDAASNLAAAVRALWEGWNTPASRPLALPAIDEWRAHSSNWRTALRAQADLSTQLLGFVQEKR